MRAVIPRATLERFSKFADPQELKDYILDTVGDLSDIEIMLNRVLVAVYIQHEKTAGGIIKPLENIAEDIWQGKPGLVLAKGPLAFKSDDARYFGDQSVNRGDWVSFRIGAASQIEIKSIPCRIVLDEYIEAKYQDPRMVTS
jgi:co-chaperonin GroES (HSP10)